MINKIMFDISELSISSQKEMLNSMVNQIVSGINGVNVIKDNTIAVISDVHADLFSLLYSLVESGIVKVVPGDFMYYDIKDNIIYNDENSLIKSGADLTKDICVFPTPYINPDFNANFYILGDVCDRGTETVACYALLYAIIHKYKALDKNPLHIAIGNHESTICNEADGAYNRYCYLLNTMLKEGCMSTGFIVGGGNQATALWHSRISNYDITKILENIQIFFNEVKRKWLEDRTFIAMVSDNYMGDQISLEASLYRNFLLAFENDEVLGNKIEKAIKTINFKKPFDVEEIGKMFNQEEEARLKILVGNVIIKTSLEVSGPERMINNCFTLTKTEKSKEVEYKFMSHDGNYNFLFWNRNDIVGIPTLNQIVGHDANRGTVTFSKIAGKVIVDIDVGRSHRILRNIDGVDDNKEYSLAATTYYETDEYGNIDISQIARQSCYQITRTYGDDRQICSFSDLTPVKIKTRNIFCDCELDDFTNSGIYHLLDKNCSLNIKQSNIFKRQSTFIPYDKIDCRDIDTIVDRSFVYATNDIIKRNNSDAMASCMFMVEVLANCILTDETSKRASERLCKISTFAQVNNIPIMQKIKKNMSNIYEKIREENESRLSKIDSYLEGVEKRLLECRNMNDISKFMKEFDNNKSVEL